MCVDFPYPSVATQTTDHCVQILKAIRMQPEWPKLNCTRSGELQKSGGKNPLLKKRWFYLKSHYLFYYSSPDNPHPKGVIVLHKNPLESHREDLCPCLRSGFLDAAARADLSAFSSFVPDLKSTKRVVRIVCPSAASAADWSRDISTVASAAIQLPSASAIDDVAPRASDLSGANGVAPPAGSNWRRTRAQALVKAVLPKRSLRVATLSAFVLFLTWRNLR